MKNMVKQKADDDHREVNGILARFAADKKKTITAVCLLLVMAVMWFKIIAGSPPQSAEAINGIETQNEEKVDDEQEKETTESKMSYIELPQIKGRNDILTRDFFSSDNKDLSSDNEKEIEPIINQNDDEGQMRQISKYITLEAIVLGDNPQAFINDKLFEVGGKLTVSDGTNTYECEVAEIGESEVTIRCGEGIIILKITHPVDVLN